MRIFIDGVIVCNSQGTPLPTLPESPTTFLRKFTPAPLGKTGRISFRVAFIVQQGAISGTEFFSVKAEILDPDLYVFTDNTGDFSVLSYRVNVSENPILLEFELKNRRPLGSIIPARLVISTRTEVSSQKRINILGNN